MKLVFGDICVVEDELIGVVVKCWGRSNKNKEPHYEVYVPIYNKIQIYKSSEVERYQVRNKYLSDEEVEWQREAETAE